MAKSWKQFKDEILQGLFPSGEPTNRIAAHAKFFVDAMIDLQTWVVCLQQDNTSLFPQCATFYNCGLTVIDSAPRGIIKRVSVVDQINATTHKEDPTAPLDWCSEVAYNEVDYCHVHSFLDYASRRCCGTVPSFFGLPPFPTPTDAGLPAGLPLLPLGYHYPQTSTDRARGRAGMGIWAKQRGGIYVAPHIQSTETVIVVWDGLKRDFQDNDPIDDDPLLSEAVREYVRWKCADIYDHDAEEAARAQAAYHGNPGLGIIGAREKLIHQCREETQPRECEPSHARQATVTSLFFNDAQSATVSCADGFTGNPVTVTIAAGTVGSAISKTDANNKAKDQAQLQANAQLVCTATLPTYLNDAQTATASCEVVEGHPPPEGAPVTVTVPAGTVSSTVSKDDANAQALAQAQALAEAQLSCVYWNSQQTYTATCGAGSTGTPVQKVVAAHTVSSTVSQADADAIAYNTAKVEAENELVCTPGSGSGEVFHNTQQVATVTKYKTNPRTGQICSVNVTFTVAANAFTSTASQAKANADALAYAQGRANQMAQIQPCGNWTGHYP